MATTALLDPCSLELPDSWVNAWKFETALIRCGDALGASYDMITVKGPSGCKLMIDVVVRLLSFCNQAVAFTKRVQLDFGPASDALGYLDRMGFFEHLATDVTVLPVRPFYSGATLHRGGNRGLVEIARFSRTRAADADLLPRLMAAIERGCAARSDVKKIKSAMGSIFGALIDNVYEHSGTNLDAYAALRTYPQAKRLTVAVSDSGIGILESLRPALAAGPFHNFSEVDLLVEIFRQGISSKEEENRGLGLMASARHAIEFKADLDVRLPNLRVLLKPAGKVYQVNTALTQNRLPLLAGTHISFSLDLG